jgi:hypothetical protein
MLDRKTRLAILSALASLVAACGGGDGGSPAPTPTPTPTPTPAPAPTSTIAQRAAAAASAASQAADCVAVQPFYWSIGDATGKQGDGSVGIAPPTAQTIMSIASASKLVYGAYVAELRAGVLADTDVPYLNFTSGYTDFAGCSQTGTVATCEAAGTNGTHEPVDDGKFYYGGGHMEKHAFDNGLAADDNAALAGAINTTLGTSFAYSQPQPAGGIYTNAGTYGAFLQRVVAGQLKIGALLGTHPVCTNPRTCSDAVYTPIPAESDHYSIGHWVEDDPAAGDGAFSSPGAFGFYPWVDGSRTWWGIVARMARNSDEQEGVASMKCGRRIRAAWVSARYP